jgi:hypothetical protein
MAVGDAKPFVAASLPCRRRRLPRLRRVAPPQPQPTTPAGRRRSGMAGLLLSFGSGRRDHGEYANATGRCARVVSCVNSALAAFMLPLAPLPAAQTPAYIFQMGPLEPILDGSGRAAVDSVLPESPAGTAYFGWSPAPAQSTPPCWIVKQTKQSSPRQCHSTD